MLAFRRLRSARASAEDGPDARTPADRLERVLAGSQDGYWEWPDTRREEVWWSPRMFELLGHDPGEFEPTLSHFLERIHPDDRKQVEVAASHVSSETGAFTTRYRIRRKDGSYAWFQARGVAFPWEDGGGTLLAGSVRDVTEKMETEMEMEAAVQHLDQAQELAKVGSWDMDLVTGERSWSAEMARIYGWTPDDPIPTRGAILEQTHPEDRARVEEALSWARVSGSYEAEFRIRRHDDGEERILVARGQVVKGPEDTPLRHLGVAMDVTDRVRTEEALRSKGDRARMYLETAEVILLVLDSQGRIDMINRKGAEILGWGASDLLGESWFETFLPERVRADVWGGFQALLRGELESWKHLEAPVLTAGGEERIIAWHNALLSGPDGSIAGTLSSGEDITARKRAERELRESQERLLLAQRVGRIGVLDRDLARDQEYWSQTAFDILGLDSAAVTPGPSAWLQAVHPEDRKKALRSLGRLMHGEDSPGEEYRVVHPNGEVRWVRGVARVFPVAGGDFAGRILATVQDVTEQKRVEEILEEQVRFEELLAHLSASFINVPADRVGQGIRDALEKVGRFLGLQRASFGELERDPDRIVITRSWMPEPIPGFHDSYAAQDHPILLAPFRDGEAVVWSAAVEDTSHLSPGDLRLFQETGMKAFAEVPVTVGRAVKAVLAFSTTADAGLFSPELMGRLELLARTFGSAIARREAEERRIRSDLIVQSIADGVITTDLEGRILSWNRGAEEIYGYEAGEVLGEWVGRMYREEDLPVLEGILRQLGRGESISALEMTAVGKGGREVNVLMSLTPLLDPGGEPIELLGITKDITALKMAEEDLRASETRLRALASRLNRIREEERTSISRELHDELGQALTSLRMDLAAERADLPEEASGLRDRFSRLVKVTDEMVGFTRDLSSRLRPPILDVMGLGPALEWQVDEHRSRTGIRFHLDVPEEGPAVPEETGITLFRITQEALTNVLRHAEAGEVWIRLAEDSRRLVLEVEDDGRGIRAQDLEAADSLGLLGMRERALGMQGDITVTRGLKGGTLVRVAVPWTKGEDQGGEG